jgi:putative addiction module component (TIGR02574 family)
MSGDILRNMATTTEYLSLSVTERIDLVAAIWDSIAHDVPGAWPLADDERAELDRRMAEYDADPSTAVPWHQVRAKLTGQA